MDYRIGGASDLVKGTRIEGSEVVKGHRTLRSCVGMACNYRGRWRILRGAPKSGKNPKTHLLPLIVRGAADCRIKSVGKARDRRFSWSGGPVDPNGDSGKATTTFW